jgi:hypothetical protein
MGARTPCPYRGVDCGQVTVRVPAPASSGFKKAPTSVAVGTTLWQMPGARSQIKPGIPRAGLLAVQASRMNRRLSATTEVASVIVSAEPSTLLRQACSKPPGQGR